MSSYWQASSQCEGKHRFGSYDQALRLGIRGENRRNGNIRPYHCSTCGGFHIGSLWVSNRKFNKKRHMEAA